MFDDYKMVHLNIDHAFTQTEFDELDKLVVPKQVNTIVYLYFEETI